jgi:hypothetical protein
MCRNMHETEAFLLSLLSDGNFCSSVVYSLVRGLWNRYPAYLMLFANVATWALYEGHR